jgi:hypothetical protein
VIVFDAAVREARRQQVQADAIAAAEVLVKARVLPVARCPLLSK